MKQLGLIDAGCLHLESADASMQMGGLYLFKPGRAKGTKTDFTSFQNHLADRIHKVPGLKKRLQQPPFGLNDYYWVDDKNFDLSFHLNHLGMPKPYSQDTLWRIAKRIYNRPLDRTRPLWEIHYIEGVDQIEHVEPGSYGLIIKIHFSLVDPIHGDRLFSSLLDFSRKSKEAHLKTHPSAQQRAGSAATPSSLDLVIASCKQQFNAPFKLTQLAVKFSTRAIQGVAKRNLCALGDAPELMNIPASMFDHPLGRDKTFYGSQLKVQTLEKIYKQIPNIHLRHIIASICAGAIRNHMLENAVEITHDLIALMPTAIKATDTHALQASALKNTTQISGSLGYLAIKNKDPISRLIQARDHSLMIPSNGQAVADTSLTDYIPTDQLSTATKLYARWHFSDEHQPFYNLVINTVPGPQNSLFLDNAEVTHMHGLTPLFDSSALVINVLSYKGSLNISTTSCARLIDNIKGFHEQLQQATNALIAAVNALEEKPETPAKRATRRKGKQQSLNKSREKR